MSYSILIMNQAKKVLITGGSGFIGGHLARGLQKSGYSVTLLDQAAPDGQLSGFPFLQQDVNESAGFTKILQQGWHAIFHFAAIVSVPECEKTPEKSFQTNFQSFQTVLSTIADRVASAERPFVFFASSAAVYGDLSAPGKKLSESDTLPQPLSFYGLHKYAAEQSLRMYCEKKEIRGLSFRFFNVYGPGQKSDSPYSGVISKFTRALKHKEEITLFNKGKNMRDFIHVSDIVQACLQALTLPEQQLDGGVLNLCTGESITILEVLKKMMARESISETAISIKSVGARVGDIYYSCGDPTAAQKKLNWAAQGFRAE